MTGPLTAFARQGPTSFWDGRRIRYVDADQWLLRCEACEWLVVRRLRPAEAESLRIEHVRGVHPERLTDRTMTLHLADCTDSAGRLIFDGRAS